MEENGRLSRFIFQQGEIVSEEQLEEGRQSRYIRGNGVEYAGKEYICQKDEQSSTVFLLNDKYEIDKKQKTDWVT